MLIYAAQLRLPRKRKFQAIMVKNYKKTKYLSKDIFFEFNINITRMFPLMLIFNFLYCFKGILDKNRDTFSADLVGLVCESKMEFLFNLFGKEMSMVSWDIYYICT